ncbi:hypothetical protein QBC41DRAFT_384020 [Cercophora samala]|uniref:Uncharacterized protein n=1 Tax=Cercophora samala TaxID=330535 RepID=A0AA40DCY9_9PEZI|nr:hypothetical protein QBC41DRAFT_384020 [Cercophora samala]
MATSCLFTCFPLLPIRTHEPTNPTATTPQDHRQLQAAKNFPTTATPQIIFDIDAKMCLEFTTVPRSEIIIAILAEEDRSLFAKLDSMGVIPEDHSESDALRFHIMCFLAQIPLSAQDSSASPSEPSPKKVAFSCNSPHYKSPSPLKLRKKKKLFGVSILPTVKTHKEYTCTEATQPLSIIWPSDNSNNLLPTNSQPPTCRPHLTLSCTDPSPWTTPDEDPRTPCHHTSWYAAISTLSQHASKLLAEALTAHNITNLSAPLASLSEARALEVNILPKLHLAYSLYTARIFITGRFKKVVIHLCRRSVRSLTHANALILEHKKPWTALENWLAELKAVYDVLNTMHLWLDEAGKKLDKAVRYLAEAGGGKKEGATGMTRGEMLPLYRCMIEVKGWIRKGAIQGVREDKERVRQAVRELMELLHPLTGLGHDKAVVEALGGLWKVDQMEEEGGSNDKKEEGINPEEKGSDDEMGEGDASSDSDGSDGSDDASGSDDSNVSEKSDEEVEDANDSNEEMKDDESDAAKDDVFDAGIEVSKDDLDDAFDREMQEQKFAICGTILEVAVEVRSVCETWRNHLAFIQAIERGQLNDHQD